MSERKVKGLPNRSLPTHWQYVTHPVYSKIADLFPNSAIADIMAASRQMWLIHADPEVIMRIAGLKELSVEDDLVTIKLHFEDGVKSFKANEPHKQDDPEAQTRLAMLAYQICLLRAV